MASRILVLSASVGAGHLRAAQAVEQALQTIAPAGSLIRNVDILELTNATFRALYGRAYLDLVNKAPHLLGYFYDLMDQPRRPRSKRDRLRLLVEKLNLTRFIDLLAQEPWDVIVNTHFLPAEIIASLRRRRKIHMPQIIATTDFETHRLWVNPPCDHYFTATEEGAAYLRHWGVPAEHVTAAGIPIHPVFAEPRDREACLKKHGLAGDRPVVLQLAGGFGVGPVARIYRGILEIQTPLQIVAVAGKNATAKKQLDSIDVPDRHRAKVCGFTTEIDELMAAADVVVSKPGGLTTSETLARGCAMAIVNPIPGQESRNSDFLLENGAAIKINNIATLPHKLGQLFSRPQRLAELKQNVQRLARPRAAFDVAKKALTYCRG